VLGVLWVSPQAASGACSNEALRTGPSAQLPDCRAYERVTPPEAAGQIFGGVGFFGATFDRFPTEPANSEQDSLLFTTRGAGFLSPPGGGGSLERDIWQAQRGASGWLLKRHVTPGPTEALLPLSGGISGDHGYSFTYVSPLELEPGEFGSLYVTRGADYLGDPSGHFDLTGCGSLGCEPYDQGRYISPGGGHVIFSTGKEVAGSNWCAVVIAKSGSCKVKQLEPDAPPSGTAAVYDRPAGGGATQVVSLLPGDGVPAAGENAYYQGASANGKSVAFEIKGTLYVRVDNETTEEVTPGPFEYGGFSEGGRYLFYVGGGDIHRFDTSDESDEQINASADAKLMNVSGDGSHVYFISPSQLVVSKGTVGEPNIYVWHGGAVEFIATVAAGDLEGHSALGRWTSAVNPVNSSRGPGLEASRVTPDGRVVIFESEAKLTEYENDGHSEVYRRTEGQPVECVSCNPSGTPATVGAGLQNLTSTDAEIVLNNLSEDGSRVFFETSEALVGEDVDGINDSYEWHLPTAIGSEPELGLISSGESLNYPPSEGAEQNVLIGITKDGRDAFFLSQDPLVPGAAVGGTPAIYDARIGGGFPEPPPPQPPCIEEGCRPPVTPPPPLGGIASSSLQGGGNVKPQKQKPRNKNRRCARKKIRKNCGKKRAGVSNAAQGDAPRADVEITTAATQDSVVGTPGAVAGTTPGGSPMAAGGEFEEDYGIESAVAGVSTPSAARHPDFTFRLSFKRPKAEFSAKTEGIVLKLPPGLYGNPNLTPRCSAGAFIAQVCPFDSQVGLAKLRWGDQEGKKVAESGVDTPLYNLAPAHPDREIARFGVNAVRGIPVFIDVSVRTAGDYGIAVTMHSLPSLKPLISVEPTIWGNPADPSHDKVRMTPHEAVNCPNTACEAPGGERAPEELGPIAFLTNPSACGPMSMGFEVTSYQLPGKAFNATAPVKAENSADPDPVTDCEGIPFAPSLEARPTTDVAGAPTGLNSSVKFPQSTDPSVPSTATMREARVTLPEGMTINPSAADGLTACSDQQVRFHEEVDAECPDASKLGSLKIVSPALAKPLEGAVYQRSPEPGHLIRLWLVTDEFGLHVKIPGEVKPDPNTGQLTAVFADLPQVPVGEIDLDIWGGARAPLKNPDTCGTYETTSVLAPWSSDPPATPSDRFRIDRASDGGPCPESASKEPNSPGFDAGTASPIAGAYSPFLLRLQREDGSQAFGALELTLPPGLVGKLAGVAECSNVALAAAAHKSGREEQSAPSCPSNSLVGTFDTAAGAGPSPFWTHGKVYLAGPYKGAPLSVAAIAPAVAGPFDLGTVVARSALYVDPETAKITVKTDPLPTILEGVPLNLRTIAVQIDRDQFMLNGTSCEPSAFSGQLTSTLGNVAPLGQRFQLAECARLGFKPKLAIGLKGGTKRGDYPALSATLKTRGGDANIGSVSTSLPHSEFLAQEHIVTICTRVQFAARKCPKGSVYGHAKAWTPLLSKPLEGPVYLRSSSHPLPDLVLDLRGQIEVAAVGRIDSHRGGIRVSFEAVPDAPVSKLVLKMKGGKKGLLTNSTDICLRSHRAAVEFGAQNGKRLGLRPALVNRSCGKGHGHTHPHR
jgi:hypothetical protein